MAPKRRPANVVRTGNAGNSSKPQPKDAEVKEQDGPPKPPPLFPAGYKTPVQMLNEKCQKNGWERPLVDSVSHCFSARPCSPLSEGEPRIHAADMDGGGDPSEASQQERV